MPSSTPRLQLVDEDRAWDRSVHDVLERVHDDRMDERLEKSGLVDAEGPTEFEQSHLVGLKSIRRGDMPTGWGPH